MGYERTYADWLTPFRSTRPIWTALASFGAIAAGIALLALLPGAIRDMMAVRGAESCAVSAAGDCYRDVAVVIEHSYPERGGGRDVHVRSLDGQDLGGGESDTSVYLSGLFQPLYVHSGMRVRARVWRDEIVLLIVSAEKRQWTADNPISDVLYFSWVGPLLLSGGLCWMTALAADTRKGAFLVGQTRAGILFTRIVTAAFFSLMALTILGIWIILVAKFSRWWIGVIVVPGILVYWYLKDEFAPRQARPG